MRTEIKYNRLNEIVGGAFTATVTGTTHYLAIRTAPDYYNSRELEGLRNGTQVTVLESPSNSWYWLVKSPDGTVGYANKRFLK